MVIIVIYLSMVKKFVNSKDSESVPYPLCLGNISKDFSVDNMKKTGLYGQVHESSIDYDAIANDKILDIHKYLMGKYGMV